MGGTKYWNDLICFCSLTNKKYGKYLNFLHLSHDWVDRALWWRSRRFFQKWSLKSQGCRNGCLARWCSDVIGMFFSCPKKRRHPRCLWLSDWAAFIANWYGKCDSPVSDRTYIYNWWIVHLGMLDYCSGRQKTGVLQSECGVWTHWFHMKWAMPKARETLTFDITMLMICWWYLHIKKF